MSAITIVLLIVLGSVFFIYLAIRSGELYGHHDAHSHSTKYAGLIREGHGPLTVFLYVVFFAVFLFSAIYFAGHASEFSTLTKGTTQMGITQ